jgi:hypothetical protein
MAQLSICILDDKIPVSKFTDIEVDDTSLIDNNLFNHYLKKEDEWEDVDLFAFSKAVCEKKDNYFVSGFTNHSFYFNYIEKNIFSPDIIVFDWDMNDSGKDSEENLLELLQKTFALVAIFTSADKENEVTTVISKSEFGEFEHNLFLVKKNGKDAYDELEKAISEKIVHFSFQKGKEIKQKTLRALDLVLSNFGKISYDEFVSLFGHNSNGAREIYGVDYCEIIMEKTRTYLIDKGIENLRTTSIIDINDFNLLRKIWHFRLYNSPKDDIVRRGDIIYNGDQNDEILFLVISSDCHLKEFWSKNLGYLTLVPIHKVENDNYFSRLLKQAKIKATKFDSKISSLTSSQDGISVFPGLTCKNGKYCDYIFFPKSIFSTHILLPEGILQKSQLKYSQLTDYSGENRLRVSEPFLTPLIQFIIENITGHGVADFSENLKNSISINLKSLLDEKKS